jgi:hypothetical protein
LAELLLLLLLALVGALLPLEGDLLAAAGAVAAAGAGAAAAAGLSMRVTKSSGTPADAASAAIVSFEYFESKIV